MAASEQMEVYLMTNKIKFTMFFYCLLALVSNSGSYASVSAHNLNPIVLKMAERAYKNAKDRGLVKNHYLTIVDYSMPSTEPRMWVIDMDTKKVKYHTHVAHGQGSGDNYARAFSNSHGSHKSSLGVFLTGGMYHGNHGASLNLRGLQKQYNSNAEARRIVVHGAHYVDQHVIQKIGRLGRSFGCLALSNKIAKEVMHTIRDGSIIFCYYPDAAWLRDSTTLSL